MEAEKETQPPIIDQLKEYAETRIKLAKYQVIEGGSSTAASIITGAAVAFVAVFALLFASFTLAFYLGDLLNGAWKGFGLVTLLYIIVAVVLKLSKASIENSIVNRLIQKFLKK
jgi:hypothetical protein